MLQLFLYALMANKIMEKVIFDTEDEVTIIGNYWAGDKRGKAVLLLHMMPATKESWDDFAALLNESGFSVLAIDLRGHGESTEQNGEILDFRAFSDMQHQSTIRDVEASIAFLKKEGAREIFIAGASIGANLAVQYQSQNPDIRKTILLSAGLNYRGVKTEPAALQLKESQSTYIIAGTQDAAAVEALNALKDAGSGKKKVKLYETAAHGTRLFVVDDKLISELVEWLKL